MPFKGRSDVYGEPRFITVFIDLFTEMLSAVVHMSLLPNAESPSNAAAKRRASLKAWDSRRIEQGFGPWNVLYRLNGKDLSLPCDLSALIPSCSSGPERLAKFAATLGAENQIIDVRCEVTAFTDVHVPVVSGLPYPSKFEAAVEDWHTTIAALTEWVGLAGLGAQRSPLLSFHFWMMTPHFANLG